MRWGVRDEATDDHMTTELCMKEIQNCQRLSMGPNFVVRCEKGALDIKMFNQIKSIKIKLFLGIFRSKIWL